MASTRGAAGGAMAGAGFGSMFGPWGTGIGTGIGALLGLFGGETDRPMSPEVIALFQKEIQRQHQVTPLVDRVYRQAFARLPPSAREGYEAVSPEEADLYAQSLGLGADLDDNDFAQAPEVRRLLRLQVARQRMADPVIQAITRMAGMRMPRGFAVDVTRKPPVYG